MLLLGKPVRGCPPILCLHTEIIEMGPMLHQFLTWFETPPRYVPLLFSNPCVTFGLSGVGPQGVGACDASTLAGIVL